MRAYSPSGYTLNRGASAPNASLPGASHTTATSDVVGGGHAVATRTVSPQQRSDASVGLKVARLRCLLEELRRDVLKWRGDAIRFDS